MKSKNIKRTLIDADGSKHTITEQRYISNHKTDYYHYVERVKMWRQFTDEVAEDARNILQATNLNDAIERVNESRWFGFDLMSSQSLEIELSALMSQSKFPSVSDSRLDKFSGEKYNTLYKSVVKSPQQKSHKTGVLKLSRKSVLGIVSLKRQKRDKDKLKLIFWCVKFWKKLLTRQNHVTKSDSGNDKNVIKTLNAVVSIDTEWQTRPATNKLGVTIRSNDDVLNVSYALYFPEYPAIKIAGVLLNETHESFNLRQFFCLLVDQVQKKFQSPGKVLDLKRINWLVTGYFLGVDWSVFDGWNKFNSQITQIDKQYIFTQQPFVINTKTQKELRTKKGDGVDNIISIRDAGLMAPQGGLKALGDIVNIHKLDTEVDDAKHGKPKGYYKQHMTEYYKDCPTRYIKYVLNDAIIPLEYWKTVVDVYRLKWLPFSSLPMTTSNYAMRGVVSRLANKDQNQRIFRTDVNFGDIKSNPVLYVRDGLRDVYLLAQAAYFGGFNTSFGSFVVFGNPVDLDLAAAYNTAGNLMPWIDYTAPKSGNIADFGNKLVEIEHKVTDFKPVYQALKKHLEGFPFAIGFARASIDYPADYKGITMTPARNQDGSPVYVRHVESQPMTLIDVLDAFEHGAKVELECLYVPAQHYDKRNAWAEEQHHFLVLRQGAKRERDKYERGSDNYNRYEAEQLLYKLAGNTIYGKSAQSVRPKRARDFMSGAVKDVEISKITDPLIAGTYTGFTRYLAHHLYDGVQAFYGSRSLPANITTDGYTFLLHDGVKFDFDGVKAVFDACLPDYYHQRLQDLSYKAGFERKGNSDDFDKPSITFNLRTRLNGTTDIDCLEALGGIRSHTYTVQDIYDAVKSGKIMLPVKGQQLSNLTEMKFGALNHMQGVLYEEPKLTRIPLQYDCSYCPDKWLPDDWKGFGFTAVPFGTIKEHDWWKKHSKELTDRYNIMISEDRFNLYLETMKSYSFYRVSELDKINYQDKAIQIYKHLNDDRFAVNREYKDALYRCQSNRKAGKRVGVCFMSVYPNLKRNEG